MLIIEIIIICLLFWGICYFNTGTDEKNIKGFSSYPNEVQHIILENPELKSKIKVISPITSFISNFFLFGVVLLIFGILVRQERFISNFVNILILGETLNIFDFLIIDMLWWRNSKRIRFTGTEHKKNLYQNSQKHFISFMKGIVLFLIIAIFDGWLLSAF